TYPFVKIKSVKEQIPTEATPSKEPQEHHRPAGGRVYELYKQTAQAENRSMPKKVHDLNRTIGPDG
ncbi:MAG: hypothetical protein AAF661_14490, partial [Pseudomonadota bacterium]